MNPYQSPREKSVMPESGKAPPALKTPSRTRLLLQFLMGTLFLLLVAATLSGVTRLPFGYCAVGVFGGAVVTTATGLAWLIRSAARSQGRSGQFSLSFLLMAMTFAAGYFALVGWLIREIAPTATMAELLGPIVMVSIFCLLLGLPVLLYMAESVIWLAAWLVRRGWVQRWVFGRER